VNGTGEYGPLPAAPFRGLHEFRYADRSIFFERSDDTARLLRTVTIFRGVLFYGDSGVGKSSLINAGLVPAALKQDFAPERLRFQPRPNEEIVVEKFLESDDVPTTYLPSGLLRGVSDSRRVFAVEDFEVRVRALEERTTPLLIFDQFEELVTLTEQNLRGMDGQSAQMAQEKTISAIVRLLRDPKLNVKLLFSFREDYLAKLTPLFKKAPELTDQFVRLTPLGVRQLHKLIRGPFELKNSRWSTAISDSVAAKVAAEIESRSGMSINLSEVQVACLQLWLSPDPEGLYERRRVAGLLEDHLSESLRNMKDLADPAVALLSTLVTASGTRNVISAEDAIQNVLREEKMPRRRLEQALQVLATDTKLISQELRHRTYFFEIVSEFLVPWIVQQKVRREERLAQRRFLRRGAMALAAFLFLSILAGYAWLKWVQYANTVKARENVLVRRAEAQVSELHSQLQIAQEDAKRQIDDLRGASTNREKADLKKLEDFNAVNGTLRAALEEARRNRDKAVEDLATLRQQKSAADARLQSTQDEFAATQSERDQLKKRVADFDIDAAKVMREAKNSEGDLTHLQAYFGRNYYPTRQEIDDHFVDIVKPIYPTLAKQARIQGRVLLLLTIADDGTVKQITKIQGSPLLVVAAEEAAAKWRFKPFAYQGKAVEVMVTYPITFTLNQ